MTQNIATLPMAYGGTSCAHCGAGRFMRRANAISDNRKCPVSTPTLKHSNAIGSD